jgi:hypothetical protein
VSPLGHSFFPTISSDGPTSSATAVPRRRVQIRRRQP